jgi:hypothetical protein
MGSGVSYQPLKFFPVTFGILARDSTPVLERQAEFRQRHGHGGSQLLAG